MIRLIAAIDRQQGIAKDGRLPWKIPSDERYFTRQTKQYGGIVLTGRVTFETFKRLLPERHIFVLTHSDKAISGAEPVKGATEVLGTYPDVWVVGGAAVFIQTIDIADELYLTAIDADFGCDRFFPEYRDDFELYRQSNVQHENGYFFRYEVWRRKV